MNVNVVIAQVPEEEEEGRKLQKKGKMGIETIDVELEDDDNIFRFKPINILGKGTNKFNTISVEHYSDHRDLHLPDFIDLSQNDVDDVEIRILPSKPSNTPFGKNKRKKPFSNPSITQKGESSNSKNDTPSDFTCEICAETKSGNDSFAIEGCSHSYCTDCTAKYVESKLQENVSRIGCPVPGCGGYLDPEHCLPILPPKVFDRWGNALCEALIVGSHKFYCPFKDCSAMLIDDGKEAVVESECPNCRRLFWAQCKVPWHSGIV